MNPMQILNSMMANNPNFKNNPMANNALKMMQNNDVAGLKQLAENLAQQKGLSVDDIRKQIGM